MSPTRTWITVGLAVLTLAAVAWGQERRERPRREVESRPLRPLREGPPPPRPLKEAFEGVMLDRLTRQLELTAEQQAQVRQILETFKQELENWRKGQEDPAALREQLRAARESSDEAALKALREKLEKAAAERADMQKRVNEQIAAVLTDAQKPLFEKLIAELRQEARGPIVAALRIRAAVAQLDLDEAQKEKIRAILERTAQAAEEASGPEQKVQLWQKAFEEVRALLTDEQRAKLEALPPLEPGPLAELRLTDAQRQQVAELLAAAHAKAKDAPPEQRREILAEALRKIRADVLTDEQREKFEKFQQEHPNWIERLRRPERPGVPERPERLERPERPERPPAAGRERPERLRRPAATA